MLLASCGKPPEPGSSSEADLPVAPVRLQPAERAQRLLTEEVVGTLRAKVRATLEAKISGRIEEMPVALGQRVSAGDLIARLDAAEIKARLEQAQASLQQSEKDWNRVAALFKGQAVTRSEYDAAEARHRVSQAQLAESEAMMRYVEVRAPFAGVVSRKWVDVGDLASPGKPLIDLENPSQLQVEADVPEMLSGSMQLGASWAVRLDGGVPEIQGRLAEMAPSVDPSSRTVKVKVDLPSAAGLMPGRFARLLVPMGEHSTVTVPASAVVQRGQLEMVFVVTNNRAQLHLVRTGKRIGDRVEVLSGLEAGHRVASDGATALLDGQRVEVQ